MATRLGGSARIWISLCLVVVVSSLAVAIASIPAAEPAATNSAGSAAAVGSAVPPQPTTPGPTASAAHSAGPVLGPTAEPSTPPPLPNCPAETERFAAGYTAYHTYAELCRTVVAAAARHPDIARLTSIGTSWQGRQIFAMEISAHLDDGTHPPGVLFDGGTHGLEHLSVEMPLAIMSWLLDGYGTDATVTRLVKTRAIFLVFDVNPDGAAFDIAGGRFHEWRKNRQPNANGTIGTDLNRNYDDHWGCCGLVSATPANSYYRGPSPFSAPETRAVRDYVAGMVFNGRQEIRAAITFHASGRLILWPYGYTRTGIPSDMTASDHSVLVALARHMAQLNGYKAEQASSLYVDSGTARDWEYGTQGIFAFTFEVGTGVYQRSGVIATEAARNRAAVMFLIEMSGCPDSAVDPAIASCA